MLILRRKFDFTLNPPHMAQLVHPFLVSATLIILLTSNPIRTAKSLSKPDDGLLLLSLRSTLSDDPRGLLASWNDSVHFCWWPGVTCGRLHPDRVVSLELSSASLSGSITPSIANLTFLRKVDLSANYLYGPIPQEIGRLFRLKHLNLSLNSLQGGIPASLSNCSRLQVIDFNSNILLQGKIPVSLSRCSDLRVISLSNNSLTGNLPSLLTNLSSLSTLSVSRNQITGELPSSIGNLYSLTTLQISENQLLGGIPASLGKLSRIKQVDLSSNHLDGDIPNSLWNLSSLSLLLLAYNNLSGLLPSNLGLTLPFLEIISLSSNQLSGYVPTSLSNASRLQTIDLSSNMISGTIPPELGNLQNLEWLNLRNNQLEVSEGLDVWSFLNSLTNCTKLEALQLDYNNLNGTLPDTFLNFSIKLQKLSMSYNQISGTINEGIGNLLSLTTLDMGHNLLKGSIPVSTGNLINLRVLNFGNNRLSGEIPSALGNLTQLISLSLQLNGLSGSIPRNLQNCRNLVLLDLSSNELSGQIPREILKISTLSIYLGLARNSLSGPIPPEIGGLINLETLDISGNKLSGELPNNLGYCQELEELYASGNFFHGNISIAWSSLRGIQVFDLSVNNLSGRIPDFLQELPFLYNVNLSFNNFEGDVPTRGVFSNASALSFLGNNNLCGGNPLLHLPSCTHQNTWNWKKPSLLFVLVLAVFLASTLLCVLLVFRLRKSRNELTLHIPECYIPESYIRISYFMLEEATNKFSVDNLIAVGSSCAVYRGKINEKYGFGRDIAVKVLNLQRHGAYMSFTRECDALRYLRHRNLVPIRTICSGFDSKGNEFKAIVFKFMANGTLDDWLHPIDSEQCEPKKLGLLDRINIAVDVASLLDYLHNNREKPLIHRDIKPDNIFLGDDMTAYVGDFGLSQGTAETLIRTSLHTITAAIGTFGYIPPEYGMANRISTKGDVYSYGVLLLEMFTGKRPTDDSVIKCLSLRKYVLMAFPDKLLDIVDARLLLNELNEDTTDAGSIQIRLACISSLLGIGLLCCNEVPAARPPMEDVVKYLSAIRHVFRNNGPDKDVSLSQKQLNYMITELVTRKINNWNNTCGNYSIDQFEARFFKLMGNGVLDEWLHPIDDEQCEPKKLSLVHRINISIDVASLLDRLHNNKDKPIIHRDIKPSNIFLSADMTAHVGKVPPEYGMMNRASSKGDVYSYGVLLLEMFTGKRPTDDSVIKCLSLHKYVDMAFPDKILDIVDSRLFLNELEEDTTGAESFHASLSLFRRKASLTCISSFLGIGLLCSNEVPDARPPMEDVVMYLHAIRRVFQNDEPNGDVRLSDEQLNNMISQLVRRQVHGWSIWSESSIDQFISERYAKEKCVQVDTSLAILPSIQDGKCSGSKAEVCGDNYTSDSSFDAGDWEYDSKAVVCGDSYTSGSSFDAGDWEQCHSPAFLAK